MQTDTDPKPLPNIPVPSRLRINFWNCLKTEKIFSVRTFALFYDSPKLKAQETSLPIIATCYGHLMLAAKSGISSPTESNVDVGS
jgi:hypothetical protein